MSNYIQEDTIRKPMGYRQLLGHLWPYFMAHKLYFYTVIAAMLTLAVIGRTLPYLLGVAIDDGILKHDLTLVMRIALVYLALELGQAYLSYLHNYLFIKMGNQILSDIRYRLVQHVQTLPTTFFDRTPTGRIATRMTNDVLALGELFTEGLIMVITNALSVIAIVVAMLLISPKLTVISLAVTPLIVWMSLHISNIIQGILRESKKRMAAINAFVAENLNGIKVLQLHNRTQRNAGRFSVLLKEYTTLQIKSVYLYALLWPTIGFFFTVSLALALYYGGFLYKEGVMGIGALVAFLMNVQDFFPPLRSILEKYQQFQNSLTGAERVFSLLQEPGETATSDQALSLQGALAFHDVSFRYAVESPPVLQHLTFEVKPGQSLAIVGRTGSGKSTIISLLQRLYESWEGQILIDGQALESYDRRSIRARIGVVQQDTFIFRGTIAQNISLFNPRITRSQIEKAVELASCAVIVEKHGGLDGLLEERGGNLSAGERQLIAFARVLAFNPDILILDEATANIDSHSESLIQQATREVTRNRTSIIIAHRLSTILECDQIMVLDQGQLLEIGSHQELLARGGSYAQLYQGQFAPTSGCHQLPDATITAKSCNSFS